MKWDIGTAASDSGLEMHMSPDPWARRGGRPRPAPEAGAATPAPGLVLGVPAQREMPTLLDQGHASQARRLQQETSCWLKWKQDPWLPGGKALPAESAEGRESLGEGPGGGRCTCHPGRKGQRGGWHAFPWSRAPRVAGAQHQRARSRRVRGASPAGTTLCRAGEARGHCQTP